MVYEEFCPSYFIIIHIIDIYFSILLDIVIFIKEPLRKSNRTSPQIVPTPGFNNSGRKFSGSLSKPISDVPEQ